MHATLGVNVGINPRNPRGHLHPESKSHIKERPLGRTEALISTTNLEQKIVGSIPDRVRVFRISYNVLAYGLHMHCYCEFEEK
jgi:hypothetical protein